MDTVQHNEVNWKQVKMEWDFSPSCFEFSIRHDCNLISFVPGVTARKSIKLMAYVNSSFVGTYLEPQHEFAKYMNVKLCHPTKKTKELDSALKKLAKKMKRKYEESKPMPYRTPVFDNITQIKRMVENLSKPAT